MSSQINKSWLNHELHTSGGGQSPSGKRWRESLAGWRLAGLVSRWSLKHAGKGVWSLLLLLVGWGVVMPVQAELIAWYPCEKDAKDHKPSNSGYAKHDGVGNDVVFEYDTNLDRTVCQFNKPAEGKTPKITGRYIEVPHSADFDLDSGPFTLSACVYQTKRNDTYTGMIFANRGTANGWLFGVAGKIDSVRPGSLKFRVNDDWETNTIRSGEWAKIPNAELSPPPQWHSVALVYNGTTAQMYMDGALVGSKSLSSPGVRTPGDTSLFIGKNSETYLGTDVNDHHYWWYGKMSNLRIEDTALSQKEIKELDLCQKGTLDPNEKKYSPKIGNFTISPENGIAPFTVKLSAEVTDLNDDLHTVVFWFDGDSYPGNLIPGTNRYEATVPDITAGTYRGTNMEATDKTGLSATARKTEAITVKPANTEPTCKFTLPSPTSGAATFEITPRNRSSDVDSKLTYQWFVNNNLWSTKEEPEFSFDQVDTYQISLTVTDTGDDSGGNIKSATCGPETVTVSASNDSPTPYFVIRDPVTKLKISTGEAPLDVILDASNSTDTDGKIVSYSWSTSTGQTIPAGQNVPVRFEQGGTHQITLTVTDDKGESDSISTFLEVKKKMIRLSVVNPPANIKPGDNFDITLQFVPDKEKPADGIEVYLEFDPSILKVNSVTNACKPESIKPCLDFEWVNDIGKDYIDFAAMSFANPVPTEEFPLVTINFTALATTGNLGTPLHFVTDKTMFASSGDLIPQNYEDISLIIGETDTQGGKVVWKGREASDNPVPYDDRITIYRVDKNGESHPFASNIKADNNGNIEFPKLPPPPDTQYICIKGKYTLSSRIDWKEGQSEIDVNATLWQGDFNQNNKLDIIMLESGARLAITGPAGEDKEICEGETDYLDFANLDGKVDGKNCIDTLDLNVITQNANDVKDSPLCANGNRRGQRSNNSGQITFQTTPIPMGLPVGSTFEVQVLVNVDATHSVDGAAVSLNYDPEGLQVVSLIAGTQLDFVLERKFDNTQGSLDFAAMLWANDYPTETFTLVTIQFTLLGEGGEHSLSFNTTAPRETAAALGGEYVNAPVQDNWMTFADKRPIYTISNYLFDAAGQPQAGVTIQIGDNTAVTNDQGFWKITNLAAGEYTVKASKNGYDFSDAPCAISRDQIDCQSVQPKSKLTVDIDSDWLVAEGRELTYLITVTNTSTQPVTGLTVTDTLPLGAWLLSLESLQGGTCDTSTVTCRDLQLAAGASATLKLVIGNADGETLKNSVMVTANEQPAVSADQWTKVKPEFSVFINDTPDPVDMLQSLTYEFMVELTEVATADATGVKLEILLPTGVTVTAWNIADGQMEGNCDTSAFPKVVCTLPDLSPSGLRQVPVTVTVKLADAGLLLFTTEATLSANEYPSDWERERTKIHVPPDILVDLAILLDTTVSMQGEIDGLKAALEKFLQTNVDPTLAPLMALITFKDEVTVKAFTRDLNLLLKVLKSLKAEGGGACPEASVEALEMAAPHVKPGGQIWLGTDASPYADSVERIPNLLELLRGQQIRFHATVTGDCATAGSANDETWEGVGNP